MEASDSIWRWVTPTVDLASVDAYTDLPFNHPVRPGGLITILDLLTSGPVSLDFKNSGANTLKVKVLSAVNTARPVAEWNTEIVEFTIAAGATAFKDISVIGRTGIRVQFAASGAGSQGALRCDVVQKRL